METRWDKLKPCQPRHRYLSDGRANASVGAFAAPARRSRAQNRSVREEVWGMASVASGSVSSAAWIALRGRLWPRLGLSEPPTARSADSMRGATQPMRRGCFLAKPRSCLPGTDRWFSLARVCRNLLGDHHHHHCAEDAFQAVFSLYWHVSAGSSRSEILTFLARGCTALHIRRRPGASRGLDRSQARSDRGRTGGQNAADRRSRPGVGSGDARA